MSKIILILLVIFSCVANAQESLLVGKWQYVEASFPLDQKCMNSIFNFTNDGLLIASDGNYVETKSYNLKPYKKGYLVETRYVSNNGKENCQGIPAKEVKEHTVQTIYIELLEGNKKIKLYLGKEDAKGFFILEKRV